MKFGLPRRKGSSPKHHFSGAAINLEGVAFGSWWHMDTNNWRFSAWLDLGLAVAAPLLPLPNRQPSVSWCARDGWESRFVRGIYPICSMYGIFTCIWHEFTVNVGKHSSPVEHLGTHPAWLIENGGRRFTFLSKQSRWHIFLSPLGSCGSLGSVFFCWKSERCWFGGLFKRHNFCENGGKTWWFSKLKLSCMYSWYTWPNVNWQRKLSPNLVDWCIVIAYTNNISKFSHFSWSCLWGRLPDYWGHFTFGCVLKIWGSEIMAWFSPSRHVVFSLFLLIWGVSCRMAMIGGSLWHYCMILQPKEDNTSGRLHVYLMLVFLHHVVLRCDCYSIDIDIHVYNIYNHMLFLLVFSNYILAGLAFHKSPVKTSRCLPQGSCPFCRGCSPANRLEEWSGFGELPCKGCQGWWCFFLVIWLWSSQLNNGHICGLEQLSHRF